MNPSGSLHSGWPLTRGTAEGQILVLDAALSFWGGMDPASGTVIDRHHPQCGTCLTGKVVVMPSGRGSSSSSSVLAEALRAGTAPAAIVLSEPDGIIAIGAIVASELYGIECPVVSFKLPLLRQLRPGSRVRVVSTGDTATVELLSESEKVDV